MEEIKILFFILSNFFGSDIPLIGSNTTAVTVVPQTKIIVIEQDALYAIINSKEDSLKIGQLLRALSKDKKSWSPDLAYFSVKNCELYISDDGTLDARIELKYHSPEDLKTFGLTVNPKGYFSMIFDPGYHVQTTQGELIGNYWHFNSQQPFKFLLKFDKFPEKYKPYKQELAQQWEQIIK